MVQANADGRPRSRRARQSEEQAPLVESYLSSSGSTSYQGICPWVSLRRPLCCGFIPWLCFGEPLRDFLPACAGEGLTPSGCAQAGCGSQLRWREAGRGRLGPGARGPCICSGILRLWESRKSLPCSCFSSCFLEYRLCARGRARPAEGQQPFRRECASHVTRHSFWSHHHRSPAHLRL